MHEEKSLARAESIGALKSLILILVFIFWEWGLGYFLKVVAILSEFDLKNFKKSR